MRLELALASLSLLAALAAGQALGQAGLRVPERAEPGLDPSFARGWLAPEYDRFGFAQYQWRDAVGFAPAPRMNWSYSIGQRADFSMSYNERPRLRLRAPGLALSAATGSRPTGR